MKRHRPQRLGAPQATGAQRERAEQIDACFKRLDEHGCNPRLTADGSTIVATCPCCGEADALEMTFPRHDPGSEQ